MARPVKPIDQEEFEDLLSLQCTKEDIAGFFHVSEKTLQNFCRKTYKMTFSEVAEEYKASGRVSIRRAQFAAAKAGNVQMLIHLGKQWLGQTDKVETNISGSISANVNHGNITRVIIYDPVTGQPTKETIDGADDDVKAYLRDHENYNGDIMSFHVPENKRDIKGERMITSPDGSTKAYVPIDGKENEFDEFELKTGKTGAKICFPNDGRGGYGFEIPDIVMKKGNTVLEDYDDGRGGYNDKPDLILEHPIDDDKKVCFEWGNSGRGGHEPMTKEDYRKQINRSQPALRKGAVINE